MTIPIGQFGQDHWQLLTYVETRCVDHGGQPVDPRLSGVPLSLVGSQARDPLPGLAGALIMLPPRV
jgi:hypothetical protein